MTYTMFDLTYRTGRELNIVYEGEATSGSTTTVVDTNDRLEPENYWADGTVWILEADAAAPESEWGIIENFRAGTSSATLRSALTVAVAAGDRYAIGKRRYPLNTIIQNVNKSIQELGPILPRHTVEVTTSELTSEYSVPTSPEGVNLMDLRAVYLSRLQYADTLTDEPWTPVHNWYIQVSAAGTPDKITIPYELPADHKLKLVYCIPHGQMYSATAQLSETIPVEYVVYAAAGNCLNWYRQKTQINDRAILDDIAYYRQKAMEYKVIQPIMPRDEKEVIDDENATRFNLSGGARSK